MGKVDIEFRAESSQNSICRIKQRVCRDIIHGPEPFALEDSPQRLCDVKMRTVWRKKEKEQAALLPYRTKFPHELAPVYACVVKHNKCVLVDAERKSATLSAVIFSVVENPSYLLLRSIMPKILSLSPLSEGIYTSSPRNCHPYGTYPSVQMWLSSP